MNLEHVRVRAYFHFENRTGRTWMNSEENWLQAEEEESLLQIVSQLQPYVCALLCHRGDPDDPSGVFTGGSATFIDTGSAKFLLTAEHVTRELFGTGTRALLAAGNGTTPLDISHLRLGVSADPKTDIATVRLPDNFDLSPLQRKFCRLASWPPERARKGEVAAFLGYPGLHRRPEDTGLRLWLTPFCDFVTSVSDRQFFLVDEALERIAVNLSCTELEPFGSIGGVSGSAVFVNRDGAMVPVGVLYEAGEGVDAMIFVAHIDGISADGTI